MIKVCPFSILNIYSTKFDKRSRICSEVALKLLEIANRCLVCYLDALTVGMIAICSVLILMLDFIRRARKC